MDNRQISKNIDQILERHASAGIADWQQYFLVQAQTFQKSDMPEYQTNYQQGLQSWLNNTYLQLDAFMGDAFQSLVMQYLKHVPLTVENLNQFEQGFLFMLQQEAPEFYDVGVVDYCIHRSYYAANATPFPFDVMSQLTQEQQFGLRFKLAPSVFSVESAKPLSHIWNAYCQASVEQGRELIAQLHDNVIFLICREEYRPKIYSLSEAEQTLLRSIQSNQTLAIMPEAAQGEIVPWIQKGFIVDFT